MPSWEGSHNWTVTDPAQNQKILMKQSITPPRSARRDDSADFALSSTEELPKSKTSKIKNPLQPLSIKESIQCQKQVSVEYVK